MALGKNGSDGIDNVVPSTGTGLKLTSGVDLDKALDTNGTGAALISELGSKEKQVITKLSIKDYYDNFDHIEYSRIAEDDCQKLQEVLDGKVQGIAIDLDAHYDSIDGMFYMNIDIGEFYDSDHDWHEGYQYEGYSKMIMDLSEDIEGASDLIKKIDYGNRGAPDESYNRVEVKPEAFEDKDGSPIIDINTDLRSKNPQAKGAKLLKSYITDNVGIVSVEREREFHQAIAFILDIDYVEDNGNQFSVRIQQAGAALRQLYGSHYMTTAEGVCHDIATVEKNHIGRSNRNPNGKVHKNQAHGILTGN